MQPSELELWEVSGNGIFFCESQPMAVTVVRYVEGGPRHLLVANLTTGEVVNRIQLHGAYTTGFGFNGHFVTSGFSDVNRYVLWTLSDVMMCKNEVEMWSKSVETRVGVSGCAMNKTKVVSWMTGDRHISVDDFWMERELAVGIGSAENNDGKDAEEGNEMPAQNVEGGQEDRDDDQVVPKKKRKLNQTDE